MAAVRLVRPTTIHDDTITRLLGDHPLPVDHVDTPSLPVDGRYHTAACRWLRRKHLWAP